MLFIKKSDLFVEQITNIISTGFYRYKCIIYLQQKVNGWDQWINSLYCCLVLISDVFYYWFDRSWLNFPTSSS